MSSYHAMVACVAAGASVTVLPASVLQLSAASAMLPSIALGQMDTCLVWRKGYDVPAFQNLASALWQVPA